MPRREWYETKKPHREENRANFVARSCDIDSDTQQSTDDEDLLLTVTSKVDSTVLSTKDQHRSRDQHKPIHATMRVKGDKTVRFQVDTGATCNVLREKDLPESVQILPVVRTLSFYNGTR